MKDNLKALLPFQDQLRLAKRRLCGYHPNPDRGRWTLQEGLDIVRGLRTLVPLPPACVLEVGSGWEPLIPMLCSLAGASQVILTDLTRLLHPSSFAASLGILQANKELILEGLSIDSETFDRFARIQAGETLEETLRRFRFRYLAPCDCRSTGLPAASVDAVISRAALEHIPPDVIRDIFKESARIVKAGGAVCHIVDNSDHWQHRDAGISRVNFLKYSDAVFLLTYVNKLNYQNRLRHSEYREMLENAGFELVRDERTVDEDSLKVLGSLAIAPRFRRFSHEDLATVASFFLARAPGVANGEPVR